MPSASPEVPLGEVELGVSIQQLQQAAGVGRMVVAKPLHPNQALPPSVRTNLASMANPTPGTCEQ